MVVDEGVLSLMGYQTPDPLAFFHVRRDGGVWLGALHPNVLARQEETTTPTTVVPAGGDASGAYLDGSPPLRRPR